MTAHILLVAGLLSVITLVDAFVSPKTYTQQVTSSSLHALPEFNPSLLLSDGLSAATYTNTQAPQTTQEFTTAMSEGGGGALGALRALGAPKTVGAPGAFGAPGALGALGAQGAPKAPRAPGTPGAPRVWKRCAA